MHILLTRPLEDSKDLIMRFKELGHQVSHLPVITIEKKIMRTQIIMNSKE